MQLPALIANISGTSQDIRKNAKSYVEVQLQSTVQISQKNSQAYTLQAPDDHSMLAHDEVLYRPGTRPAWRGWALLCLTKWDVSGTWMTLTPSVLTNYSSLFTTNCLRKLHTTQLYVLQPTVFLWSQTSHPIQTSLLDKTTYLNDREFVIRMSCVCRLFFKECNEWMNDKRQLRQRCRWNAWARSQTESTVRNTSIKQQISNGCCCCCDYWTRIDRRYSQGPIKDYQLLLSFWLLYNSPAEIGKFRRTVAWLYSLSAVGLYFEHKLIDSTGCMRRTILSWGEIL